MGQEQVRTTADAAKLHSARRDNDSEALQKAFALLDPPQRTTARKLLESSTTTLAGSSSLTAAELRVLPLLPTYLSFQEIADRLLISRNTVKTHAMSIYGKLWATSRGEAVERAVEIGLLEAYPALSESADHASATTGGDADDMAISP